MKYNTPTPKTVRGRANKAARMLHHAAEYNRRMLRRGPCFDRGCCWPDDREFESCFECDSGREVVKIISRRIMQGDAMLARACLYVHGFGMLPLDLVGPSEDCLAGFWEKEERGLFA